METVDFNSEIVVFKPSQGSNEFEIILDGEHDTVWVTEEQLVELFGKARRTIGEHIRNIYKEGELDKESTWRKFRQVQKEGERKVNEITLVALALALAVAQSLPDQRDLMIKLVVNLIKN
ncbi:MAG TPA: hypothetical protein VK856_03415 [Anaerolineaceae bacterium]|nr:hypothetical protein [Anaerolineaceae bacterium]